MPPPIPTSEPTALAAGDSWAWDVAVPEYPAGDGWALLYVFVGAGSLHVEAQPGGIGYEVRVTAAETGGLPAGRYRFAAYATRAPDRHTVRDGWLTVTANLATATDARSEAEQALAAIDATLAGRITADVESMTVNGRSVVKIPIAELRRLRAHYATIVARERGHGGPIASTMEATFV